MALSKVVLGVLANATCGTLAIVELIFSKMMLERGWPYFRLGAASFLVMAAVLTLAFKCSGEKLPRLSEMKWLVLRGFFGNATLVAAVVAVELGAPAGDVGTLTSINVVLAAVMGHCVLGERLRWPHLLALFGAVAGALLVSRPSILFGREEGGGQQWPGYVAALVAGFFLACIFVCARKSAEESSTFASIVEAFFGIFMFPLMPLLSLTPSSTLDVLAQNPGTAAGYGAILFCVSTVSIMSGAVGSQWCPAAVGATVITTTTIVVGYLAQILLYGDVPRPLTLVGAGLMLVAVVVMAATRVEVEEAEEASPQQPGAEEAEETKSVTSQHSSHSLLSFAAAEYAQVPRPVRRRSDASSVSGGVRPIADTLGAVSSIGLA